MLRNVTTSLYCQTFPYKNNSIVFKFEFSTLEMRRTKRHLKNLKFGSSDQGNFPGNSSCKTPHAGGCNKSRLTVASLGISLRRHHKKTPWVSFKSLQKTFGLPVLHLVVNCAGNLPSGAIKSSLKAAFDDCSRSVLTFIALTDDEAKSIGQNQGKIWLFFFFSASVSFFLYANSEGVHFQMQSS